MKKVRQGFSDLSWCDVHAANATGHGMVFVDLQQRDVSSLLGFCPRVLFRAAGPARRDTLRKHFYGRQCDC